MSEKNAAVHSMLFAIHKRWIVVKDLVDALIDSLGIASNEDTKTVLRALGLSEIQIEEALSSVDSMSDPS